MKVENTPAGPAMVSAGGKFTLLKDAIPMGGWKLVSLDETIDMKAKAAKTVFREFNPPTMDEETYLKLLESQGFFAQYKFWC